MEEVLSIRRSSAPNCVDPECKMGVAAEAAAQVVGERGVDIASLSSFAIVYGEVGAENDGMEGSDGGGVGLV